jgi:alkanesulfonate monooxygenase SsuD/methylene tetrahydromethanopterin reductase-like flavin-dependent oxidoreductase (luciferase family)
VRAKYRSQVRDVAKARIAAGELHWDEMVENGYVVIGSPDTVREQLEAAAKELNIGNLAVLCQFGNMRDDLVRYNTKLFGEQVAPGLRPIFSDSEHPYWPAGAA